MDHEERNEQKTTGRVSRRGLVLGGAAAAGGMALSNVPGGMSSVSAASSLGFQAVPSHGPKRTIIWALAAIADWNLSYDIGFNDAARFVGWEYRKIGVPIAQYSAVTHINAINQAIQAHPDVLVTPNWVEGVGAALDVAIKRGIYVVINNANNYPAQMSSRGLAYIGANEFNKGVAAGNLLAQALAQAGKKSGTIISGNPYAENANVQDRVLGAISAITAWNKAHGTSFSVTQLSDNSGASTVNAITLWKAKITQTGPALVGCFASADQTTQAAVRALQEKGFHPGQYPMAAVDISSAALTQIQQGWVLNVIDAGFYMQGWLPVMLAWQALQRDYPTSNVYDTSGAPITRQNLAGAQKAIDLQTALGKQYGVIVS